MDFDNTITTGKYFVSGMNVYVDVGFSAATMNAVKDTIKLTMTEDGATKTLIKGPKPF
jgi:hypothetical protein